MPNTIHGPARSPQGLRRALALAVSEGVPWRSFWAAVLVGSVLNAINQGDVIVSGRPVSLWKLGLTYVVPYLVATYGAVAARRHQASPHDAGGA